MYTFFGKRNSSVPSTKGIAARKRRAFSLIELMVSLSVFSLLAAGMVSGLRAVAVGASKQVTDNDMGFDARTGVDEMLTQIRGASSVIPTITLDGKTYTTGANRLVMKASGYDPATPSVILNNVTDYIVIDFDSAKHEIRETVVPGSGSKRPLRVNTVLARNVDNLSLTYRTRDRFKSAAIGLRTYSLSVSAALKPEVSVDGLITAVVWNGILPNQILVVSVSLGQDVEAWYPINPNSSSALASVKQIDVDVDFESNGNVTGERSMTMTGSACLRNQRK